MPAAVCQRAIVPVLTLGSIERSRQYKSARWTVFGNEVGERIGHIATAWRRPRRAGIKDLHFHDLRREYTSRLREAPGISDHEIRDLLGHANISTTSRYLATTRTGLQRAVQPFEAHRVRTSFAQNADKEAPPRTNEQPATTANLL